eukprot:CCRYP_003111-RA/>CCRYP_003111-RA protein AED:0.49 eAED:0.64 QI:0/-1/0/1/-1/0/1/0/16
MSSNITNTSDEISAHL